MLLNDDEKTLPGQMCYDELEPIEEKKEEKPEGKMEGQISFDDLSSLLQQKKYLNNNNNKNVKENITEKILENNKKGMNTLDLFTMIVDLLELPLALQFDKSLAVML